MRRLTEAIDRLAVASQFSGVVRVDRGGQIEFVTAYGLAHRGCDIANTVDTRFAIASGVKGLTALTVVSLIDDGQLTLATTARSVLGDDLPSIGDDVTIEHLLAHRSGIGDHIDEDTDLDVNDYVMPVSAHQLETTRQYLPWLDGCPTKFPAGERFSYCNGGYVVLALIVELLTGTSFHELVRQRVCMPAGMHDSEFLRSDEPSCGVALGYLSVDGSRTNVFHLPVKGSGDGGMYTTVADVHSLWDAIFAGRIVSPAWIGELMQPRSTTASGRYGLGFWLHASRDVVMLVGMDAGVSFRSVHDPRGNITYTAVSNTSDGAWPIARHLDEVFAL